MINLVPGGILAQAEALLVEHPVRTELTEAEIKQIADYFYAHQLGADEQLREEGIGSDPVFAQVHKQLMEAEVEFETPFEVAEATDSGLSDRMMHKIEEDASAVLPAAQEALSRGNVNFIRYELNELLQLFRINLDANCTDYRKVGLAVIGAQVRALQAVLARHRGEVIDPVGTGLVPSLARPDGNITGLSSVAPDLEGKRIELLREVVPKLSHVAVFFNSLNPFHVVSIRQAHAAAEAIGVQAAQLNAVFFTHIHSDHTEGFSDIVQMRWIFGVPQGPKLDVVCSTDEKSQLGFTVSCSKFVAHIDDAYDRSGETAYRAAEMKGLVDAAGPVAGMNVITFHPKNDAQVVWKSGDVKVSAIRTTHIPGSAAYRVDTPAGSVVIGGDASNDVQTPPRKTSTSDEVEKLANGADIVVHTTIHPVLSPERGSGAPPPVYYRQSNATDLGAMAQRDGVKYLMLTHLAPSLGAPTQGTVKVPGGPLTEQDYRKAAQDGGYARRSTREMPRWVPAWIFLVVALVRTGRLDEARQATQQILLLSPTFTITSRASVSRDKSVAAMMADGLRKAGIPE